MTYIKKMQNIVSIRTTVLTEAAIGKKRLDVSIRKVSCIIG